MSEWTDADGATAFSRGFELALGSPFSPHRIGVGGPFWIGIRTGAGIMLDGTKKAEYLASFGVEFCERMLAEAARRQCIYRMNK